MDYDESHGSGSNATFSALLAGQAVHWFIAGEFVDHSALRIGFVVLQLILGVTADDSHPAAGANSRVRASVWLPPVDSHNFLGARLANRASHFWISAAVCSRREVT